MFTPVHRVLTQPIVFPPLFYPKYNFCHHFYHHLANSWLFRPISPLGLFQGVSGCFICRETSSWRHLAEMTDNSSGSESGALVLLIPNWIGFELEGLLSFLHSKRGVSLCVF